MTSTFQCEYCQCFTFKRCDKFKLKCTSHGGMYSVHHFGKIYLLQWGNLNESFRPYYIHYEDYVKRF